MSDYPIDPDAKLDYQFNFTEWLREDEEIASYEITRTEGVTVDTDSNTTTAVTVWLSGAELGYPEVTCHVVTNQGREDDRTLFLTTQER
jgi:hypothetical protein